MSINVMRGIQRRASGSIVVFLLLLASLSSSSGLALDAAVKQLVDWETTANDIGKRSPEAFPLEHFEIPIRVMVSDLARDLPQNVAADLIFEKNGERYVRWVINPDDTKWHVEIEKYLTNNGLDATRYRYFTGYRTASRTMVAEGPTGAQFFVKVSTNRTGGNWQDKKFKAADVVVDRATSDLVVKLNSKTGGFKNFVPLPETAGFGILDVDQAMSVRSIGDMDKGKYYLPGFSALSTEAGGEIARLNGALDPVAFWREHYAEPLGRAIAEYNAYTGLQHTSPHSQNFLIELDAKMKPTGRIVLRDFGDAWYDRQFMKESGYQKTLLKIQGGIDAMGDHMVVSVGFVHGSSMPAWLKGRIGELDKAFFTNYEQEYSKLTGVPIESLQATFMSKSSYATKFYPVNLIRQGKLKNNCARLAAGM